MLPNSPLTLMMKLQCDWAFSVDASELVIISRAKRLCDIRRNEERGPKTLCYNVVQEGEGTEYDIFILLSY